MRVHSTRSTRGSGSGGNGSGSFTNSVGRILLALSYFAWAMVPLAAMWPEGDPHPQTTAMFLAVQSGNRAGIEQALCDGLDVDSHDETGITPLMAAARGGHIDAVRQLLAAGAEIDACSPVFGTSLIAATMFGHHEIMRELIDHGANVDAAADPIGRTALWYARVNDDEEAVHLLLAAGAVSEGRAARARADKDRTFRGAGARAAAAAAAAVGSE